MTITLSYIKAIDKNSGIKIDVNVSIPELKSERVEIKNISETFRDIFFKPPDPKMYIDGITNYGNSERILIGRIDSGCDSQSCQTICVYGTGRIETYPGLVNSCP